MAGELIYQYENPDGSIGYTDTPTDRDKEYSLVDMGLTNLRNEQARPFREQGIPAPLDYASDLRDKGNTWTIPRNEQGQQVYYSPEQIPKSAPIPVGEFTDPFSGRPISSDRPTMQSQPSQGGQGGPPPQQPSQSQPPQSQEDDPKSNIYQKRSDFRSAFIKANNLVDPYKINADEEAKKVYGRYPNPHNPNEVRTFDAIKRRVVDRIKESQQYTSEALQRWEMENGFDELKQGTSRLKGGKVSAVGGYNNIPADSIGMDNTGKMRPGIIHTRPGATTVLNAGSPDERKFESPIQPKEIDETKRRQMINDAKKDADSPFITTAKAEVSRIRSELEGMSEENRIKATVVPEGSKLTMAERLERGKWKAVKDNWNKASGSEDFEKWVNGNIDLLNGPKGAKMRNERHADIDRRMSPNIMGAPGVPAPGGPPPPKVEPFTVKDPTNVEEVANAMFNKTPDELKAYGQSLKNPKAIEAFKAAASGWFKINPETGNPDTSFKPHRPGSPIPTEEVISGEVTRSETARTVTKNKEQDSYIARLNSIARDVTQRLLKQGIKVDPKLVMEEAKVIMKDNNNYGPVIPHMSF